MMVLEDVVSEMEKELRVAEKAVSRVTLEWRSIKAKEQGDTDAVRSGVTQKAASESQSCKAEVRARGWRQTEGRVGGPKVS